MCCPKQKLNGQCLCWMKRGVYNFKFFIFPTKIFQGIYLQSFLTIKKMVSFVITLRVFGTYDYHCCLFFCHYWKHFLSCPHCRRAQFIAFIISCSEHCLLGSRNTTFETLGTENLGGNHFMCNTKVLYLHRGTIHETVQGFSIYWHVALCWFTNEDTTSSTRCFTVYPSVLRCWLGFKIGSTFCWNFTPVKHS